MKAPNKKSSTTATTLRQRQRRPSCNNAYNYLPPSPPLSASTRTRTDDNDDEDDNDEAIEGDSTLEAMATFLLDTQLANSTISHNPQQHQDVSITTRSATTTRNMNSTANTTTRTTNTRTISASPSDVHPEQEDFELVSSQDTILMSSSPPSADFFTSLEDDS